jgi:hypothetical protein
MSAIVSKKYLFVILDTLNSLNATLPLKAKDSTDCVYTCCTCSRM